MNTTPAFKLQTYQKLALFFLLSLTFLAPLVVIPSTINLINTSKWLVLILASLGTILSYLSYVATHKKWQQVISPLTLPLVLFGGITLVSSFVTNPFPTKSLLGMGGAYLALSVIGIFGGNLISQKKTHYFVEALGISGAILSITSFLQLLGWGPSQLINRFFIYNLPNNMLFSLSGSSFIAAEAILLALIGVSLKIYFEKKLTTLHSVLIPLLFLGLAINVWSFLPGQIANFRLTPVAASWSIAVDSIREPRSALIGYGPASYQNIYAKFKPNWINGLDYWQFNFSSGTSFPFTLIVTLGITGLIAWGILALQVFKQAREETRIKSANSLPIFGVLLSTFVLQLITPNNFVLISLQAAAIAFWVASKRKDFGLFQFKALFIKKAEALLSKNTPQRYAGLYLIIFLLLGGLIFLGYKVSRVVAAEYALYQAANASQNNNIVGVYDNQRKAVGYNPHLDAYRRQYALTNLQIALALSNKSDISAEERSQVVTLIDQAVNEAKAATSLDSQNSANWVTLAEIYKNLIGSAQEAEQWALNALVEAVNNDPTNPLLRVEIGLIFYNQQQYQNAAQYFNQTINLKPDLAIGYYQMGRALVGLEQYIQAENAWQQALLLLDADSEDATVIQKELDSIKDKASEMRAQIEATQQQQSQGQNQDQSQTPTQENSKQNLGELNKLEDNQKPTPENEPTIVPLTEQNVSENEAEIIDNPANEPLVLSPETEQNLNEGRN